MSPTDATRGTTGPAAAPRRVFLSHTSDLGKPDEPGSFVAAAVAAVLRARHAVTDMAYFGARDTSPAATCVEMVAQSDVYVGIIGLRYGSPVRDRPDVSYTELEFETAGQHDQPRLIFIVREDAKRMSKRRQSRDHRDRQDAFRRRLLDSGLTAAWVDSPSELELAVYQALVELGPTPDAPDRLAEAQALLASMPTDVLPDRGPLPAGSRMPLAPNPLFVGRGDELLQVARALRGGDTTVALGQVVASTGLGGLGKTQLAVELIHRYGRFFAGGVSWLSFASADEIPLQVASCAGPDFASRPVEERVQRVRDAWQSAVPRLLVFDNCEEETLLDAWRPPSGACRVLVTSRRSEWSPILGVTALPLDLLRRSDSIELLRQYRPDLTPDDPSLDTLAAELGDLPLALHLAGSYLRTYRDEVSLDGYMAELRRSAVVQHASLIGSGLDDVPNPTHHVQSVAQTFALCLGRLDREREVDRVAIGLLARMAWMAPGEPLARDLLAKTLAVDPRLRTDGLRRLGAVGLVQEGEGWLRLHRLLVHFARQAPLDPASQSAVVRALIQCGRDAEQGQLRGAALAAVIPHLIAVASRDAGDDDSRSASLCTSAGIALFYAGDLRAARVWLERALSVAERGFGPDHPITNEILNDLGHVLQEQGEFAAAEAMFERALAAAESTFGPDHANTAAIISNLALVLSNRYDFGAARPLVERALAIRERELGPHHPHTAVSLTNLAALLVNMGEFDAARPLFERALAIREQVFGSDHPETAFGLHSLGALLMDQGEVDAAKGLFERALAIWEGVLGPDHPDTAHCLNSLANLLRAQGESDAARPLYERALAIRERVLGAEHPYTATSLIRLALLLQAQGELDAARPLLERALAINESALGSDHPTTARSLGHLAGLLQDQGELEAARMLQERAVTICERTLGPDHPDTGAKLHNLASLRRAEGDLDAARLLLERAVAVAEKGLGLEHPRTASSLDSLALVLQAQGDPAAARPLFERALAIRERVLGPDHPDTVATRRALAELAAEGDGPAADG